MPFVTLSVPWFDLSHSRQGLEPEIYKNSHSVCRLQRDTIREKARYHWKVVPRLQHGPQNHSHTLRTVDSERSEGEYFHDERPLWLWEALNHGSVDVHRVEKGHEEQKCQRSLP